jgi:hypothetical protein
MKSMESTVGGSRCPECGEAPANGNVELTSYLGFFCILWFTWCQVTLYDVRFATDSVFERIAHICHFAVMVGLAIVGPRFNPRNAGEDSKSMNCLQALSLILMSSRIVLLLQYSATVSLSCFELLFPFISIFTEKR